MGCRAKDITSGHVVQVLRKEYKVINFYTNFGFFFAGNVSVFMPSHSL